MGSLLSVFQVVLRRVRSNGRLLLAVVVGAVLASALMSTTSIYTDAIRDLGLDYAIRQAGPDKTNVVVASTSQGSGEDTYLKNGEFIESTAKATIGPLIRGTTTRIGRSSTFYPAPPGEKAPTVDTRPRSHLQFVTDIEKHVRVIDGRLPSDASFTPGQAPTIDVAIGAETAQRQNVRVGDRYDLHPFWDTNAQPVHATVVGIIEPVDAGEAFWVGENDLFYYPSANWATLALFVSPDTFFKAVAAYLPTMISDYKSLIYLDTSPINARNAAGVRQSLLSLDSQLGLNVQRTTAKSELPNVLQSFDEKLFFTRIPLLVLVLQIAGIVLYYLFMVSTMLVERQTPEIALLKSRGATTAQVMQIYAIEGLVILVIGLALGPPLAATVISLLGHTPMFSDLSEGSSLSVRLSSGAYMWASAGAILSYLALLIPCYLATKRTVVQQRTASARPAKQTAFTRYYLDLVLVAIAAVLFYQLNRRSDLVTDKLFGEQSVDPILLLTPTFFTLTVGIVFLRLFPLALRLLSWFVGKAQGTTLLIGMWQLVRNPTHYSRLVLLLMLATAVGMFAASFGTTLNRSYEERAAYESGASLRLKELRKSEAAGPLSLGPTAAAATGAEGSSSVVRLSGSQGPLLARTSFDIMGVDPATFDDVAYFRGDFAGTSLPTVLDRLAQDGLDPELALPPDAKWLGVWFNPTDVRGRVALEAEARDVTGRYFVFTLGPDAGYELAPGWVFLVADLSRPLPGPQSQLFVASPPQGPFKVTSLSIRFITRVSALNGAFQIDDLQTSTTVPDALAASKLQPDPNRTLPNLPDAKVVAGFDTVSEWAPVQGLQNDPLKDDVATVPSGKGGTALELRWQPVPGNPQTHGLKLRSDNRPLAIFASEAFLKQSKLAVGDRTTAFLNSSYITLEVAGSYSLFPTLGDPRNTPSAVANGPRLEALLNARPGPPAYYADEVWLKAPPEAAPVARKALADGKLNGTLISFAELRTAQQKDPLVAAGWEGILFISFAAILILSAIGFLIYSYLTAQRRTLEFAVLRTMGFSKRQIAGVVGFEQTFVIGLGMLAGTLMGLRLGGLMIRYMGVTETGDEVLPPMALHVSWLTVGSAWLVLALVFLVTIGIVVLLYSRLALHRVLRIGEA